MTAFTARVLALVRAIPPGQVATYGDVAAFAGRPGAARAVGNIMRDSGDPSVPAHRVTAANGALGGFGGASHVKRERLTVEGVRFRGARLRDFATIRWEGPGLPPARKARRAAAAGAGAAKQTGRKKRQSAGQNAGQKEGRKADRPLTTKKVRIVR